MGRFQGDLPERTFNFALCVLDLINILPNETKGWVVSKQLVKSATSIGANVHEANNALTEAEFASISNIARREAAETCYWLRICKESGMISNDSIDSAIIEAEELAKILSTIVHKTRIHMKS